MALMATADSKISPRDFTIVPKAIKKIVARVPLDDGVAGNGEDGAANLQPAISDSSADERGHAGASVDSDTRNGDIDIPQQTELDDRTLLALIPPPPDPAPVIVKPVMHRSRREVCDTVTRAAEKNDLPIPFFIRLLFQESHFKPGVVSRAGAQGIAQFMPDTSESVGLDNPFDPLQAIPASARLLRDLLQQFGNLGLAAAAYNAGPKRIQDWLAKKTKLPEETKGYVKTITGKPVESWTVAAAGVPPVKLPRHAPCQDAAGLAAWDGPDKIPTPSPAPNKHSRIASSAHEEPHAHAKDTRHAMHKAATAEPETATPESKDDAKVTADQLTARRQKSPKAGRVRRHKDEIAAQ